MSHAKTFEDEIAKDGEFKRTATAFRNWVKADGSTKFKPEKGRYVLYISFTCPWASRCMIVRSLKGLEDTIPVIAVEPNWGPLDATEQSLPVPQPEEGSAAKNILFVEKYTHSWVFSNSVESATKGSSPDTFNSCKTLRQLYRLSEPQFDGKYTVPVLWDLHTKQIVNNESAEICKMFNKEFDEFAVHKEVDLRPKELEALIDQTNDWMYNTINNGVYRCGFARSQQAYDEAFNELFKTLDEAETRLSKTRFLLGNRFTESDVRLFVSLIRFDAVYYVHFKTNLKRISDYPNLDNWVRDVYQLNNIHTTVLMEQIKNGYYGSMPFLNPFKVVPNGPVLDFSREHNRSELFSGNPLTGAN